jgi:WbqC-like protein family
LPSFPRDPVYLSGNAAQDYLDDAQFAAAGIGVVWHNYVHPSYAQQHGEFVPFCRYSTSS